MFSFGIGGTSKECLVVMFGDFERTASKMKKAQMPNCTYRQIKKECLVCSENI